MLWCNNKTCEVKRLDGSCGSAILGYCEHQVEKIPEEKKPEIKIKNIDNKPEINYFDVEG